MFVNFENVLTTMRRKLPFGIAQIGRSFRNEITPGNFIFRDREFEQMEMEFFVQARHRRGVARALGRGAPQLVLEPRRAPGATCASATTPQEELSHYSKGTVDIEYHFPLPAGPSSRASPTAPTSTSSSTPSSPAATLEYFDEETSEHIVPYVIEPAVGVDRCFLAVLIDAYDEEEVRGEKRTRPAAAHAPGADQGGGPAPLPQRAAGAAGPRGLRTSCARTS